MGILGEAFVEIRPELSKFSGELKQGVEHATDGVAKQTSGFDKLATVGGAAFKALSAGAIGFGAIAIKTAIAGEQTQAQLRNAIENTGDAWDAQEPKIERASKSLAKFGFTNEEVSGALTKLTQTTGSSDKALANIGLAADIARARHIDLAAASVLVGKVLAGNVGILRRYGIETKDAAGNTLTAEQAIEALQERMGGAAAANAETFGGKMQALSAQLHNTTEEIGTRLLPVVIRVVEGFADVISFFDKNRGAAVALGVAIGSVLVPAMTAYVIQQGRAVVGFAIEQWKNLGTAVRFVAEAMGTGAVSAGTQAAANAELAASTAAASVAEAALARTFAEAGVVLPDVTTELSSLVEAQSGAAASAESIAAAQEQWNAATGQTSGLLAGMAPVIAETAVAETRLSEAGRLAQRGQIGLGTSLVRLSAAAGITLTAVFLLSKGLDTVLGNTKHLNAELKKLDVARGRELADTFLALESQGNKGFFKAGVFGQLNKALGLVDSNAEQLRQRFDALAEKNPIQASRLIESLQQAGVDTRVYEGDLKRIREEHKLTSADARANANAEAELGGELGDAGDEAGALGGDIETLAQQHRDAADAATEQQRAQTELEHRLSISSPATLDLHDAMAKLADKESTAADKTDALKSALDALIGVNISAEQATDQFRDGLVRLGETLDGGVAGARDVADAHDELSKALADQRRVYADAASSAQDKADADKAVRDAQLRLKDALDHTSTGLDQNTARGRENRQALADMAQKALEVYDAQVRLTGPAGLPAADAALALNRQALIDTAVQHGVTREAAEAYINTLGLTPDNVKTTAIFEKAQAEKDIADLNAKLIAGLSIPSGQQGHVFRDINGDLHFGARGGFIDKLTFLGAGEDGPEVLLPLTDPRQFHALLAAAFRRFPSLAQRPSAAGLASPAQSAALRVPSSLAVQTVAAKTEAHGGDTFNITVNNPIAERTSASLPRELRRAAYLKGKG